MIECLSKCQDYNQRLIFMIYDCAVNMNYCTLLKPKKLLVAIATIVRVARIF